MRSAGFKSRKFAIVVLGMLLATGAFLVLDFFPAAAAQYPTFVGCLMGLAGLYAAGNVGALHVATRNGKGEEDVEVEPNLPQAKDPS